MRRWIRELHGGQLTLLLLGLAGAGFIPFAFAYDIGVQMAGAAYDGARSVVADSILYHAAINSANANVDFGLKFLAAAVVIWTCGIAALWIWLGGRRRGAMREP